MKKKLLEAKLPLPKFKSENEEADYYGTHSVGDIWDKLPAAKPARVSKNLAESIRQRHARAKSPISIRLEPDQIAAAKRIATAKSVDTEPRPQEAASVEFSTQARQRAGSDVPS